jgi:hypothetical protein
MSIYSKVTIDEILEPSFLISERDISNVNRSIKAYSEFVRKLRELRDDAKELSSIFSSGETTFGMLDPGKSTKSPQDSVKLNEIPSFKIIQTSVKHLQDFFNAMTSNIGHVKDTFLDRNDESISDNSVILSRPEIQYLFQRFYEKTLDGCFELFPQDSLSNNLKVLSVMRIIIMSHVTRTILTVPLECYINFFIGLKNLQLYSKEWTQYFPATWTSTYYSSTQAKQGAGNYYTMLAKSLTLIEMPVNEYLKYLRKDPLLEKQPFVNRLVNGVENFADMLNGGGKVVNTYINQTVSSKNPSAEHKYLMERYRTLDVVNNIPYAEPLLVYDLLLVHSNFLNISSRLFNDTPEIKNKLVKSFVAVFDRWNKLFDKNSTWLFIVDRVYGKQGSDMKRYSDVVNSLRSIAKELDLQDVSDPKDPYKQ